jgi:hypothetical protein
MERLRLLVNPGRRIVGVWLFRIIQAPTPVRYERNRIWTVHFYVDYVGGSSEYERYTASGVVQFGHRP